MWFVMDSQTDPRFGAVKLLTDHQAVAGEMVSWLIRFEAAGEGIAAGGAVRFALCYRSFCGELQCDRPDGAGYVSAIGPEGVRLLVSVERITHPWDAGLCRSYNLRMSSNVQAVTVRMEGGALARGQKIEVTLGDRSRGGPGFQAPRNAAPRYTIWAMADPDGGGSFHHFRESPSHVVLSGPAASLRPVLPSVVQAGEAGEVRMAALDGYGNRAEKYTGVARVEAQGEGCRAMETLRLSGVEKGSASFGEAFSGSVEGFLRLRVSDGSRRIAGAGNPCRCVAAARRRIYWAEIHGHSVLSDGGSRSAEEYYGYGRDVAFLDVCALTDHDFGLAMKGSRRWEMAIEAARKFYRPGRFVTLVGWENTHIGLGMGYRKGDAIAPERLRGHKNVYYREDDGPLFNSSPYYGDLVERHFESVEELWDLLGDRKALAIPHHSSYGGAGTNWDFHNPRYERLVEIYSKWGNSEYVGAPRNTRKQEAGRTVQDALARGYRLGFTAGSDTHDARPGNPHPEPGLCEPSGLTAILAPELTREAIWDALHERRCYATTGARIYLDFTLSGCEMGAEARIEFPPKLKVEVGGTSAIDRIEVIRDNLTVHMVQGSGDVEAFEWEDAEAARGSHYYYIRVTQSDGEIAWSSPIWVEPNA